MNKLCIAQFLFLRFLSHIFLYFDICNQFFVLLDLILFLKELMKIKNAFFQFLHYVFFFMCEF